MGIAEGGDGLRRTRASLDCEAARTARTPASGTERPAIVDAMVGSGRGARVARPSEARAARASARAGARTRPVGPESERQEPEMALGILLARRAYLSELAARADARRRARLRARPRADASEAAGSFAVVLETRRESVPGLPGTARVSQNPAPRLNTRSLSRPNLGSLRVPSILIGIELP